MLVFGRVGLDLLDADSLGAEIGLDHLRVVRHARAHDHALLDYQALRDHELLLEDRDRDRSVVEPFDLARVGVVVTGFAIRATPVSIGRASIRSSSPWRVIRSSGSASRPMGVRESNVADGAGGAAPAIVRSAVAADQVVVGALDVYALLAQLVADGLGALLDILVEREALLRHDLLVDDRFLVPQRDLDRLLADLGTGHDLV